MSVTHLVVVRHIGDDFDAWDVVGQTVVAFLLRFSVVSRNGDNIFNSIVAPVFVNSLLQPVSRVGDFRTATEVQLQLLWTFEIPLTPSTKRLLKQPIDVQLLSFQLRFLFGNRGRLFGKQSIVLFKDGPLLCHQRRFLLTIGLQLCVFLFEQFEFRHAGQGNDLSGSHQVNAFNFSKKEAGFREHVCPQNLLQKNRRSDEPIDHIACSKINLGG